MEQNIERREGFSQVCVWYGTVVGADRVEEFTAFMQDELGVRIQYLEEILTLPDMDRGITVSGTGGRNDVFFAVHEDDISKFAVKRLAYGIKWVDDVLSVANYDQEIYPKRVFEYCSWKVAEETEEDEDVSDEDYEDEDLLGARM